MIMRETMLSCEGMGGLMTVIAVSGSVVVLLALGRQKLLENCTHSLQSPEDEDACRHEDDSAPVSCNRFPPLSVIIKQVIEEKEKQPTQAGSKWGRILVDKRKDTDFNLQVLQSTKFSKTSMAAADETCSGSINESVKKKVRFSEDVVEPCGDGKEYRKRQSMAMRERLTSQENCSWNNHHRHQQQQQQRNSEAYGIANSNTNNQPSNSWSSDDAEQQMSQRDQAKPSLPANRTVLYNAIIQSRSRRSLSQYY